MRLTLLVGLALAGPLAACDRRGPESVAVVVIGDALPVLVDPADGPLSEPQRVAIENRAQGLVRFDSRGEIVPGLAERWNVSDDGLSYVFRLGPGEWPGGRDIRARDVASALKRQLRPASRNALKDTLGAVEDIVAMTDRVIEIRLIAPRPNLLRLLAQPEFGILRERRGTGPFLLDERQPERGWSALTYRKSVADGPDVVQHVKLRSAPARSAVAWFAEGEVPLVLGGTFADLPRARAARLPRNALRFDPTIGLFGLAPRRTAGPLASAEARRLLSDAIERAALVEALEVPGLQPRSKLLQDGLEGLAPSPSAPPAQVDPAARRAALAARSAEVFGAERPAIRVRLPDGPGGDLLLRRLQADWGLLGLEVSRSVADGPADFVLVDAVAPTNSPAWFVRQFRCGVAPVCSKDADPLMESARLATVAAQRAAFFAEAARLLDEETAFIALAAPIRWSLVDDRVAGFAENIVARHPLVGIDRKL